MKCGSPDCRKKRSRSFATSYREFNATGSTGTRAQQIEDRDMKIVVIGGSGLVGSKTVERLRKKGHEVVAASPSSGVDTMTGGGLTDALAGAQVVVDVANSPSFEDKQF